MKAERCMESGCELMLPLDPHRRRRSPSWSRRHLVENGGLRLQREMGGGKQESLTDEEGAHLGDGVSVMEGGSGPGKWGWRTRQGTSWAWGAVKRVPARSHITQLCFRKFTLAAAWKFGARWTRGREVNGLWGCQPWPKPMLYPEIWRGLTHGQVPEDLQSRVSNGGRQCQESRVLEERWRNLCEKLFSGKPSQRR